jgi:ribosomal protein S27AE
LCLNFVEGGGCYATGKKCLLGLEGRLARNSDTRCELQGNYDVWLTQSNDLLVSDIGFPSGEPKQCLALEVNRELAMQISERKRRELGTKLLTTQRRCLRCARTFWMSEHREPDGLIASGQSYLCPLCIRERTSDLLANKLDMQRYWCG